MSASVGLTRGRRRMLREVGSAVLSGVMASTLTLGTDLGRPTALAAGPVIPPGGLYSITDLGALGGYAAFALNDYGDVVGGMSSGVSGGNGFLYSGELSTSPGTLTDLGPGTALAVSDDGAVYGPGHGTGAGGTALAVTPDGQTAAGTAYRSGLTWPSYAWPNGSPGIWSRSAGWRNLYDSGCTLPGLFSAAASAINSSGTLVGQGVRDDDGNTANGGSAGVAFACTPDLINPGRYRATDLATFGGPFAGAFAINRGGTIAGKAQSGGGPIEAFIWNGFVPQSLGTSAQGHPPTAGAISQSAAYGINDVGDVVGTYGPTATSPTVQVGSIANRAFIWSASRGMQDLTDLLPSLSPWTLRAAFDINNRGQIVGQGSVNGKMRAFLLTPRGDVNITADRIVVTQVIQNERNLDLLVARKTTWAIVRTHSDTRDAANVTAVLRGRRGDTQLGTIQPVNPRVTVRQRPKPDVTEHSFIFALPPAWTAEGDLTLEVQVNGDFRVLETDYADNGPIPTTVTFRDSPLVKIVVVDPYFIGQPRPAAVNTVAYNNLRRLVGRLLPTPALDIRHEAQPIPIPEPTVFPDDDPATWKCSLVLSELHKIRSRMHLDPETLLYGQMPLMADGTSPYVSPAGCSYVPDMVATGWTGTLSDGVAAHELVHAIGRNHVPYCNAVRGDNPAYPGVATGRLYAGSLHQGTFPLPDGSDLGFTGTSFLPQNSPSELMTYCFNWWISDYTYENVFRLLPTLGRVPLTPDDTPLAASTVNLVGMIDLLTGTTELSVTQGQLETAPSAPIPGPYHIEFYDGATKLSDVAFTPVPLGPHQETGGESPQALIDETVAMPAGADRMAIFDDRAGREISSTAIGGSAPTVAVISPQTADLLPASGSVTVEWSSHDVDGDAPVFTVLYQPTDGGPWSVLASGISDSSLTVGASVLAGATDGTIRVVAHDGFFTGSDDVTGLGVPGKPPVVTIDAPADGSVSTVEQSVLLTGYAQTVGAIDLPDSAFVWRSDRDGTLGTGPTVLAGSLTVGVHEVTLRVTGLDGRVGEATVTIDVRAAGGTPSMLAVSFNELSFTGTPTSQPDPQGFEIYDPAGTSLGWTATSDNPAVTLSASAGTTPAMVDVDVDTSGLLGGETLSAKVTVRRSNGSQEPLVVDVSAASSLPLAGVSPGSIDFGRQAQGTTGAPHTVTFTYNGRGQMTLGAATLAGAEPAGYALSADLCSDTPLATGQSCTVAVSFRPTLAGRRPAYLVLADAGSSARWFVALTGVSAQTFTSAVVGWGDNDYGQLGVTGSPMCISDVVGERPCNSSPVSVQGLAAATEVVAGGEHSLALESDGTVWAWGQNDRGELGNGTATPRTYPYFERIPHPHPEQVQGLSDVKAIAATRNFSMALKGDGTVWTWGSNESWNLGNGSVSVTWSTTPVQVKGPGGAGFLTHVVAIAAGSSSDTAGITAMALKDDGTVWAWGGNRAGDLGNGSDLENGSTPSQVVGPGGQGFLTDVRAIAKGMALKNDGTVWTWGEVELLGVGLLPGLPGYGYLPYSTVPVQVLNQSGTAPLTGVTAIAADASERFALGPNGVVFAWGPYPADLGTGVFGYFPAPVRAPGGLGSFSGVTDLQPGLAVTTDGAVWGWGRNDLGQVGAGTTTPVSAPVRVVGLGGSGFLSDLTRIAGGVDHHLAITSTGGGSASTLIAETPGSVSTTAGATFDAVIGSFDDSGPSTKAFAFAASVDWGDGSSDSATTIAGPDGGPFEIHGSHTYARPGTYAMTIDVIGRTGDNISLTGSVSVANVALGALPAHDANFTAGAPSRQSLAEFSDPNPASTESSFSATVDWGDGSAVGTATVSGPPGGPFSVNGEHTYRRAGAYPLVLHVVEVDGAEITLPGNAIVAPASLTADATFSSDIGSGTSFSGPVASFRDGNPLSSLADYTAVIDWGDGSRTAGAVSGPTGGPYTVAGSHTYATTQPFTATVTLTGPEGASASADTTLLLRLQHISLAASATPASGDVPLDAVFSYVVRNDGTDPLWAVSVDGSICGPAAPAGGDEGNGVLDPGESWSFTCRRTFNEAGTFTDVSWASAYGLLDALPVRSGNVSTEVSAGGTVNEAPILTVPATASGQYSDPIATIGISATDVDNELTELRFSIDASKCTGGQGLPGNLGLADNGDGTATITGRLNVVPGTYTPCVVVTDGDGGEDAEKITITVTKEDATIVDILPTFIQIDGSDDDIDSVALTGKFVEAADGFPSSTLSTYATAYGATDVKFDLSPIGSGSSGGSCTDTGVPTTGGSPVGCLVLNLLSDVYQIDADIQGAWFDGIGIGSLAVFDPANGFATGGGHFIWSDGPSPWTGAEANFGFTGKLVNKNAKGSVLLVIHTASGPYVIKTNAFSGLANKQVTVEDYWYTSMTGKATYSVPTGQVNPYCSPDSLKCGNFTVIMYAEDRAEPGAGVDTYKLKLIAPNNAVVFDMSLQTILGGNVQVPHKQT